MKFEFVSKEEQLKTLLKFFPEGKNTNEVMEWAENNLRLPLRSTSNAAGYDFILPIDVTISAGKQVVIPTFIKAQLDADKVLELYPRSSYGIKKGLSLANTVGVIDSDYYNNQINMSYVGIGVTYVPGSFVITRVYKNSPAEMAGFKTGDILVSVNGTELEGKTSDEVKSLVLGEEGTVVEFTIKRDSELMDITAVRGSFEQTVYARKLDEDTVYLELMSFGVNSGNECIEY